MIFERIKTLGMAHNAYLLASKGKGILIDPRRDVEEYVQLARSKGVKIEYILNTHRQEDFVLGSNQLKKLTDAKLVGGDHKLFEHCDIYLKNNEEFEIGEIKIKALHTPGHTPESMTYAVYIKDAKDCWGVFTGDALFIGEAGRTDLPDKNKTAENAELLYESIHKKILPLGPQTLLYPAHGSGSVCGGNIAENDHSTLGLEFAYNPAFTLSKEKFVEQKVHERLPHPPYFSLMEEVNLKGGIPLESSIDSIKILTPEEFSEKSNEGIIIDTRLPEAFAGAHIPKSFSIWLDGLSVFGGWVAKKDTPIYLVLENKTDLDMAYKHLTRIGMDNIKGVLTENFEKWRNAGLPIESSGIISAKKLNEQLDQFQVVDVREVNEYEDEGHIPGSLNCYVGNLVEFIKSNKIKKPIVVTCSVGHRASLGVSILLREGQNNVSNFLGGMTAWKKLGNPTKKGDSEKSFYYVMEHESFQNIGLQMQ
ncbi:MAG: MBL fold metallo-hydrolase [Oligoflexia bacterium]|nr:MBL fold metallo-hydrolase [Oligoflexia bacterium]MBF0364560.1 MBL fold metallo-hydrolase [Oligoflexia bacterium]